jgi:N-acetylmuramoyl-L-alanine amidase
MSLIKNLKFGLKLKKKLITGVFWKIFSKALYRILNPSKYKDRKSCKRFMGLGGGIIKRVKRNFTYAAVCMLCLVVAAVPISGAVGDENTNVNDANPADGLQVGVTGSDVQEAQSVIQNNKPFGENSSKILGNNSNNGSLKLGASGDKVKELQQWLTDYGYYSGDVDGVFGADTEKAVKAFQEESGLIVDGVVGKDTKKAMESWDKYLAQVQAAGEDTSTSTVSSSSKSTTSKKTYATAVRSYSKSYSYSSSRYGSAGTGDCWDNSNAMYSQFTSSGTKARIVQYANSYVSNHRSVEVWNGNGWVDADYSSYGWRYQPTAHDGSATVIASS